MAEPKSGQKKMADKRSRGAQLSDAQRQFKNKYGGDAEMLKHSKAADLMKLVNSRMPASEAFAEVARIKQAGENTASAALRGAQNATKAGTNAVERYSTQLKAAGGDRNAVAAIADKMRADKSLKAADVKAIAHAFNGGGVKPSSAAKGFELIGKRSLEIIRTSNQAAQASKARPWGIAIAVGVGLLSALGKSETATAAPPADKAPSAPAPTPSATGNAVDAAMHTVLAVGSSAVVKAGIDMIRTGGMAGGPRGVLARLGGGLVASVGAAGTGLNAASAINAASRAVSGSPVVSGGAKSAPPAAYLNDAARQKAAAADATQPAQAAVQPNAGSGPIDVPGYTRADGTVVKGYSRQRSF